MGRRLKLEVFENEAEPPVVVLNGEDYEDARLAAFEEGYRAGWDDAMASRAEQDADIRSAIAARLADLSGAVADVRVEVVTALRPLLADLVAALLPKIARQALPSQIVDALAPFAELATETALELVVSPDAAASAEAALVEASCTMPIRLVEDPACAAGVAVIRLGPAETRIDLDAVINRIDALVADFFDQIARERRHG